MAFSWIAVRTALSHLWRLRPINNVWHRKTDPEQPFATVVMVHGLYGHHEHTWKQLLKLLEADPQLPNLQIVSWGWTTGALIGRNGIAAEGRRLIDEINLLVPVSRPIVLVGHSMGGLAIFDGITGVMQNGFAQQHPCSNIDSIVLYATPTNGAEAASLVSLPLRLIGFGSKQLRELTRGTYTDKLLSEVVNRIYRPSGASGSADSERKIPIFVVVGYQDKVVPESSAKSVFQQPMPVAVQGGHSECKSPADRFDARYIALQRVIVKVFNSWFVQRCRQVVSGKDETERDAAFREIQHQCRSMFVWYLEKHRRLKFSDKNQQSKDELVRHLATLVIEACGTTSSEREISADAALNQSIWMIPESHK